MLKIILGCEANSEFGNYSHRYRMSFHRVTFYPANGGSSEIVFNGSATENWSRNAEIAIRQHDAKLRGNNPAAAALGSVKSDKKAAASRKNGKLGGRPVINKYHAIVANQVTGKIRTTRNYATFAEAQEAGEKMAKRDLYDNCSITVVDSDNNVG